MPTLEEYVGAIEKARNAGEEEIARELTRRMAESMQPRLGPAMATAMQGPTLGLADEIAGAVLGPGAAENIRQDVASFRAQAPLQAMGLEMAGAIPAGIGIGSGLALAGRGAGPMARAAQWLTRPTIRSQATLGGLEGAVAGAGMAQPGERGIGAMTGAVGGGVLGGAAAPLAGAITRRVGPGMQAERLLQTELGADLGRTPTAIDYAELAQRATEQPQRTLAELSGPAAEMQAKMVRSMGGEARGIAQETVEARRRGISGRLREALAQGIGTDESFQQATERLAEEASRDAGPLYRAAFSEDFVPDDELISLTQGSERQRLLRMGYNRAKQSIGIRTGQDLPSFQALVRDANGFELLPLEIWDQIKRGLDDIYSTTVKRNKGLAGDILDYKRQIVAKLDELGPEEYAQARTAWAGPQKQKEALELGQRIFKEDPEYIASLRLNMSDAEKDALAIGAAQSTRMKLGTVPPEGGMPRFSENDQRALREIFDTDTEFDDFWANLTMERDMQRFRNLMEAQSVTADVQSAQERAGRMAAGARGVADIISGQYGEGARTIAGALRSPQRNTLPPRIADPLASMLFSQGPGVRPVMQRLQRPPVIPTALPPLLTTEGVMASQNLQDWFR